MQDGTLCCYTLALAVTMGVGKRNAILLSLSLLGLGSAAFQQAQSAACARTESTRFRPIEVSDGGYVSSRECRSCHPAEYASWYGSYHRTMTQPATPASVRGDFDDVALGGEGGYRLQREGERFLVSRPGADAKPLALVTGSHHMQIYWYELGEGRKLGQLPYAFLLEEQRWVPRGSVFLEPPRELRPDESGRWAVSCIACHATQGQPRLTPPASFDTQVAEFGIACEACHGPGDAHVAAMRSPAQRYARHLGAKGGTSIVHPAELDHARASEICSQCHAVWQHSDANAWRSWNQHGPAYRPGGAHAPAAWLFQPSHSGSQRVKDTVKKNPDYTSGQFWSDGAARVSGREYSGMIDSPCYSRGELSCLSCHSMHKRTDDPRSLSTWADDQLSAGMDGDRACTQCHDTYAAPTALTAHTRHAAASSGSRCYNCHMPHTSYGLMKAMRSHRIDVPSASSTLQTGRPNACNLCHLDKSLGWTAEQLARWYGTPQPELTPDQAHVPSSLLQGVTGDAGQRALIAWTLGWEPAQRASRLDFAPALLGLLMDDPYDSVRFIAERSFRRLPGADLRGFDYDFVTRPEKRQPIAAEVARRAGANAASDAEIQRLQPQRDLRDVLLLE